MPTVLIKSWKADSTLFDGDLMAGPVPSLFGDKPNSSLAGITAKPRKFHWDLMKICRLLFMPESVSMEEASTIVKKPR